MLWHDQTKVGNYDEAIRIPDTVEQLLQERRSKTIRKFVQWNGREPTAGNSRRCEPTPRGAADRPSRTGVNGGNTMQSKLRKAVIAGGALLLIPALSGFRYTGFNDTAARVAANKATTWLKTQQQADGSFEVAGFPGFETPDAILAMREHSSRPRGMASPAAVSGGGGTTRRCARWTTSPTPAQRRQAAKIVVLTTKPLALNPKFGPDGDGPPTCGRSSAQRGRILRCVQRTLYAAIAADPGQVPPTSPTSATARSGRRLELRR
jgi:hypothetical protein